MSKTNNKKLRITYSKLSSRVRYKIKTLENRFIETRSTQRYGGQFLGLREREREGYDNTEKALKIMIKQMKQILASGELSIVTERRQRASAIKTFHNMGFTFVNDSNIGEMFQFLDDARARGLATMYGSDQLIEVFDRMKKQKMTNEQIKGNIDYWSKQKNSKPLRASKNRSSDREFEKPKGIYKRKRF